MLGLEFRVLHAPAGPSTDRSVLWWGSRGNPPVPEEDAARQLRRRKNRSMQRPQHAAEGECPCRRWNGAEAEALHAGKARSRRHAAASPCAPVHADADVTL